MCTIQFCVYYLETIFLQFLEGEFFLMKKYLSLMVAVLLLVCAGSAFAAELHGGENNTQVVTTPPSSPSFELNSTNTAKIAGGISGADANTPVVDMTSDPDTHVSTTSTSEQEEIQDNATVNGSKPKVLQILGKIVVTVKKIVTTAVDTSKMSVGDRLAFVGSRKSVQAAAGEAVAAADDVSYSFLDKDANEITEVPEDKVVNLAVLAEPGNEYTLAVAAGALNPGTKDPGSSGGGCSTGFTVLALAVLGGFIAARKK